jgi:hypothetical protein
VNRMEEPVHAPRSIVAGNRHQVAPETSARRDF